ncbi:RNA polymerase factor sigma-54 [Casimicrobium huifangae]|uniref:RNA polymerase factor sigma-54 n=1 Tax=Casimicrobium huifangae TaxID=2591109 RepID=UPI0012EC8EE8|nr:RNA polymerase factor sigma-54 [Casimicrobium huifangae]
MKAGLQLKLAQHLTLTPQLQQSIRLLQLSTLELQQEITAALAENPLLELADADGGDEGDGGLVVSLDALAAAPERDSVLDGSDVLAAASAERIDTAGFEVLNGADAINATDGNDGGADTGDAFEAGVFESDLGGDNVPGSDFEAATATAPGAGDGADSDQPSLDFSEWGSSGAGSFDDDDESFESQRSAPESLTEHLRSQLPFVDASPEVEQLLRAMIECLDEDGFLGVTREDIEALLPRDVDAMSGEAIIAEADWAAALRLLQGFDPPGVGARDLRECLLLQLASHRNNADVRLARRIVAEALDALGRRDYVQIRKLFDIDDEDLKAAHAVIRTLTPRPGAPFADVSSVQMIPDVIVRRSKRRWVAELNPVAVPRLSVNTVYADMLQRQKEGRSTPLSTQLQEARWLVKNVAQRFDTILRVASEIVERQQAFFDHGEVAMRPLVLREVADALGLHESTVSRVTTQKFLASTRGSFELKYFFGSHVATDAGGAASSTAIRAMIKSLIAEEDANEPLTDSRIAEMLGEQGIIVARRTVAKYRELQNIAPVNLRRRN